MHFGISSLFRGLQFEGVGAPELFLKMASVFSLQASVLDPSTP